jgi:hypothetical protein
MLRGENCEPATALQIICFRELVRGTGIIIEGYEMTKQWRIGGAVVALLGKALRAVRTRCTRERSARERSARNAGQVYSGIQGGGLFGKVCWPRRRCPLYIHIAWLTFLPLPLTAHPSTSLSTEIFAATAELLSVACLIGWLSVG